MTAPRITRKSDQQLQVSGCIDFDNALDLKQQGERLISKAADHCQIDFSDVSRAGSAALTVLFSWLRHAANLRKTIEFTNLPDDLLGVAKVSGVDQILPLK
jgi:phospholipid transport system transporter-binding protein|tara:strand:+ start:514 stop:816 length:303 start_codon:yes stop_codon:yes gene_type:complete